MRLRDEEIEPGTLQDLRVQTIVRKLVAEGARSVVDLGCGAGDLLSALLREPSLERIVGLDIAPGALELARERLPPDPRITLLCGSYTAPPDALRGTDAATLIETIEHIDPSRLSPVERGVFEVLRPRLVLITTPNREYNVNYGLGADELRHPDHRFEWDRRRFWSWTERVGARAGYRVRVQGIGDPDPGRGQPTHLAIFTRRDAT